jgi:cysteine desulfurase
MPLPVHLDHNATTPLTPGVLEMTRYLAAEFGNPSSSHRYGHAPKTAIATARVQVAGCSAHGRARSCSPDPAARPAPLAICGVTAGQTGHIITRATEHPAVLETCETCETCKALTAHGIRLTVLPVDECGLVDPADLAVALTDDTLLVSVMHANNETGIVQPITELAALAHSAGALYQTEAAQTAGKIGFSVDELGVDLLSVAAHKFGGPKGVGALYLREGITVTPVIRGGGQEHGLRSGTENTAGIAGLGAAAELAATTLATQQVRVTALRDARHRLLAAALGDRLALNGHPHHRLPNTLNISIAGIVGAQLLAAAPAVAASTGSACHDGTVSSPVLTAMGCAPDRAAAAIRLSLGPATTHAEIEFAAQAICQAVQQLSGNLS